MICHRCLHYEAIHDANKELVASLLRQIANLERMVEAQTRLTEIAEEQLVIARGRVVDNRKCTCSNGCNSSLCDKL